MKKLFEPSNYQIREAILDDAEGIAFVHEQSWKTSYAGLVDQSFLDNISYEKRLAARKDFLKSKQTLHLVVLLGEKIVGFADAGPIRQESYHGQTFRADRVGEIYAIYLLEEYKRKGLGKALFAKCCIVFPKGYSSFVAWALRDNHQARAFYEKAGGSVVGETIIKIGDQSYPEVCYCFRL